MRRRTRLACGFTTIGAALAVAVSAVVPATAVTLAAPSASAAGRASATWVTLITGDRVLVRVTNGRTSVVVEPAAQGGAAQFQQFTVDGDQYVLPADAVALVRDGVLDRQLFNVTGLVRQGYDDASTAHIPLLVRYTDAQAAKSATAPAGATLRRTLPRMGTKALDEKKAAAAQFWGRLTTPAAGGARPTSRRQLATGIQRVWLNGKVRASLDQSVPQIGAPAAWSHGLTGAGVTVAVLDTGIDTKHADFAARLGVTKDFSGKGNVEDGSGHGTHVASTVAGSGAASDGKYKGVAPNATLAIGKVLDDSRSGTTDTVLAGMEWAASQSGAKVVNMSLGGYPSDGTDPLSVAVNDLTNQYGTLFVIAAGNWGGDETVSAPATADKALTVGSVSKSDVLSLFSSRGPRLGDRALKPDLVAPGEGIVAARAAGVDAREPVGDAYQRASGTSMATPHVAGSAALLAQQHPDWKADQIKAALMSTAVEVSGAGPYAVGTGRVDVARATTQPITATGSVSTYLTWPNLGTSKKQTVTWHNTGTAAVTLSLSVSLTRRDGQAAAAGLVTVSAGTVTVPAGGGAPVEVTVTAQDGGAGEYGGILTARSSDGTVTTRTGLSVYQEEEKYDLTVNLVDRDGAAATGLSNVKIVDLNHGEVHFPEPGQKIRLPLGRYALIGFIETPRAGQQPTFSLISYPELNLDHGTVQTLDARDGKRMSVTSDNPLARGGHHSVDMLTAIRDCACTFGFMVIADPRFYEFYAATVPGTSSPSFAIAHARRAVEPSLALYAQPGEQPFEVPVDWLNFRPPAEQGTLPAVYGGDGTPEALAKIDARGKLVLAEIPTGTSEDEVYARTAAMKAAGAKLAMLIPTDPALIAAAGAGAPTEPALPTMAGSGPIVQRFLALVKAGEGRASYVSTPYPRHRYELVYGVTNQLTTDQVHQPKTKDLVAVRTAYHDNAPNPVHHALAVAEFFGGPVDVGWSLPVQGGQERVEYFTPGTWELQEQAGGSDVTTETLRMEAGREYHVVWNKAVAGPTLQGALGGGGKGRPWAWRQGNVLDVVLPMLGDSAGRPRAAPPWTGVDSGSISLYRNGQLVGTVPAADAAGFDVPDAEAGYRLVAVANRAAGWWPLSTRVEAAWTFSSSAADDGKALPLLTARFDPAVDLRNRAPGGGTFSFPAYVARQGVDTVNVTSLTVEVSYDDGETWQPATVVAAGDHWNISVQHPATGFASLRAKATDADGNTVEQTILRAYEITSEKPQ